MTVKRAAIGMENKTMIQFKPRTKPTPIVPEVIDNTGLSLSLETIRTMPYLGQYRNEWRQRTVELYRPFEGKVISIGTTFDGRRIIVCLEPDSDHWRALDAFKHNRPYTAY